MYAYTQKLPFQTTNKRSRQKVCDQRQWLAKTQGDNEKHQFSQSPVLQALVEDGQMN